MARLAALTPVLLALLACGPAPPTAEDRAVVEIIPRHVLFGNPDRLDATLSPDGSRYAYIAPDEGVLNVWVADVGQEVFRALSGHVAGFELNPSRGTFRAWLWTITHNKIMDFWRRRAGQPDAVGGTRAHEQMAQLPAGRGVLADSASFAAAATLR